MAELFQSKSHPKLEPSSIVSTLIFAQQRDVHHVYAHQSRIEVLVNCRCKMRGRRSASGRKDKFCRSPSFPSTNLSMFVPSARPNPPCDEQLFREVMAKESEFALGRSSHDSSEMLYLNWESRPLPLQLYFLHC